MVGIVLSNIGCGVILPPSEARNKFLDLGMPHVGWMSLPKLD